MIAGSPSTRAPILVLGLGNLLLQDDGVGLRLVEELRREARLGEQCEFVDGGTQGIALLGYLEGRRRAVILDAVALGAPPGTVHVLDGAALRASRAATAHEPGGLELLALAEWLGQMPEEVTIIGIEPERARTGIGLSKPVEEALPVALARAQDVLKKASKRGEHVSGRTWQNHRDAGD